MKIFPIGHLASGLRKKISYEWDIEITDEHGDIQDHEFFKKITEANPQELKNAISKGNFALTKKYWLDYGDGENGELDSQAWAYVRNGQLETSFDDGSSVPQKFIAEFQATYKNISSFAQTIYRGDEKPVSIQDFDPEYGTKVQGKELGSAAAWGPGIYFVDQEDIAHYYGSNITKLVLQKANLITPKSPKFQKKQIDKILQGVEKEKLETAAQNWDENPQIGRRLLIESIMQAEDAINQLMTIWADVYYHQNPQDFMNLMIENGIDGISMAKTDSTGRTSTYYVIYNKAVLK